MWLAIKGAAANVGRNLFTDKDGDFCPTTATSLFMAGVMAARFMHTGSTDFAGFAQGEATVLAIIAAKRWSENR